MSDTSIVLKFKADVAEMQAAQKQVREFQSSLTSFGANLSRGFAAGLGFSGMQGVISGLATGFRETIAEGIRFNGTLEQSRLGIASVLKTFNPGEYRTFNDAIMGSTDVIEELKKKALETPATFEELLQSFQGTAGAMAAAGIPLKQQVGLMVNVSQAMAALGIRTEEMRQEATALLMGNIDRNARLAQTLGITAEQIRNAKEQGRLYEFLTDRLKEFGEAGSRAQDTINGMQSRLKDASTLAAAEYTKELAGAYKELLASLTSLVSSESFKEFMTFLSRMTAGVVSIAAELADVLRGGGKRGPRTDADTKAFETVESQAAGVRDEEEAAALKQQAEREAARFERRLANLKRNEEAVQQMRVRVWANSASKEDEQEVSAYDDEIKRVDGLAKRYRALSQEIDANGAATIERNKREADAAAVKRVLEGIDARTMKARDDAYDALDGRQKQANENVLAILSAESRVNALLAERERLQRSLQNTPKAEDFLTSKDDKTDPAVMQRAQAAAASERLRVMNEIAAVSKRIASEEEKIAEKEKAAADKKQRELDQSERRAARAQTEEARRSLQRVQSGRKAIEADPYLSREQKQRALVTQLKLENAEIERNIDLLRAKQATLTDEGARETVANQITDLGDRQSDIKGEITANQPQTMFDSIRANMTELMDGFATVGSTIAAVVGGAVGAVSDGISDWILGAQSFGQAMKQIGANILNIVVRSFVEAIVSGFAKLIIQYAITKGAMFAMDVAYSVKSLALQAAMAAKSLIMWIPSAIAASISSYGAAAAIGAAAVAAILVAKNNFAEGGYTGPGGKYEVAGTVHKGEVVFSQADVRRHGGVEMVEAMRLGRGRGYTAGGIVGSDSVNTANAGSGSAMQIVLVDSDREAKRLAKNSEIDTRIIQVARANRYQIFG